MTLCVGSGFPSRQVRMRQTRHQKEGNRCVCNENEALLTNAVLQPTLLTLLTLQRERSTSYSTLATMKTISCRQQGENEVTGANTVFSFFYFFRRYCPTKLRETSTESVAATESTKVYTLNETTAASPSLAGARDHGVG